MKTIILKQLKLLLTRILHLRVLANKIGADLFCILTDVPKAYINFNTPKQKALDRITTEEAKKYHESGEFGAGSMGPKVMACVKYVKNGGTEALITEASHIGCRKLRNENSQ